MEIPDEVRRRLAQMLTDRTAEQNNMDIPLQQRDAMELSRRAMASGDYAPMMNNGQISGYNYSPFTPQRGVNVALAGASGIDPQSEWTARLIKALMGGMAQGQ